MMILKNMLKERREKPNKFNIDFFDYVLEELKQANNILTKEIILDLMFVLLFASFVIRYSAFGGNTRNLGSFGEETDKTTNLHQHLSRISTQKLETASQITRDAVTTHIKTASQDL
ncbi:MAK10-like protein [Tanacetum coccineum]